MDEKNRRDMFRRLNAGERLDPQEKRKGIYEWAYDNFLRELVEKYDFKNLCPLNSRMERQGKHIEFVLKFFVFSESYTWNVAWELDLYMERMSNLDNSEFLNIKKIQEETFKEMVEKVKTYLWDFKKPDSTVSSSQRFEAIAIGINNALKTENWIPEEKRKQLKDFVNNNPTFKEKTTVKWGSNSPMHFRNRVNAVKDFLCSTQNE